MATRFEIVLPGRDKVSLRAAADEALDEISRWEDRLSFYRNTSEIARINTLAATQPVRISAEVFGLIEQSINLSKISRGAFDITVAPLMECWGFTQGSGAWPDPGQWREARNRVGFENIELDGPAQTIRFRKKGMRIDLGSIGKGFAIDCAARLLRDLGIANALIHGGTSTVCGIGGPSEGRDWNIAVELPATNRRKARLVGVIPLRDGALSVSGVWGKAFRSRGGVYGHVMDPRSGKPVQSATLAAASLPSATETDALSTALLVTGSKGFRTLTQARPNLRSIVVEKSRSGSRSQAVYLPDSLKPSPPR